MSGVSGVGGSAQEIWSIGRVSHGAGGRDIAQGYYMCRPLPPDELMDRAWLIAS